MEKGDVLLSIIQISQLLVNGDKVRSPIDQKNKQIMSLLICFVCKHTD